MNQPTKKLLLLNARHVRNRSILQSSFSIHTPHIAATGTPPPYFYSTTCVSLSSNNAFMNDNYSRRSSYGSNLKSIPAPQYQVQNKDLVLQMRPMAATFRSQNNYLKVHQQGRLLMELIPKNPSTGKLVFDDKRNMALSPEEMGLFLQPRFSEVGLELTRKVQNNDFGALMEKVLKLTPGENGSIEISLDYISRDENSEDQVFVDEIVDYTTDGPMKYTLHAGEVEVIKLLFQQSIPILLGWETLIHLQASRNTNNSTSERANRPNYGDEILSPDGFSSNMPF